VGSGAEKALNLQPGDPVASNGDRALIRWKRLAPFFLLGPISGPLVAGVVFNFREGRPVLGALYAVALVELTLLLPVIVTTLGLKLI
jgi:hypothetical protein